MRKIRIIKTFTENVFDIVCRNNLSPMIEYKW